MSIKKSQGFTLIELMIVVAIIGILASVAIPAYADYTQRTKVAGAVTEVLSFKQAVSLCYQETSDFANCDSANAAGNMPTFDAANFNYVSSGSVTNGVIAITTEGKDSGGTNLTITMTPTATPLSVNWALTGTGCTTAGRSISC